MKTRDGILDFAGGNCIGINGFTEMPVRDQLAICHEYGGCPVADKCKALGLIEPTYKDDTTVYGGLHPRDRWLMSGKGRKARR
jgi:hypothetical protein